MDETKIDLWQHTVISVYFGMTAVPVFAQFSSLSPSSPLCCSKHSAALAQQIQQLYERQCAWEFKVSISWTGKIKSMMVRAKAAFNKKNLFSSKQDLNLRNKLVKCYIWSIALCGAENWGTLESRSQIPLKFLNMVLEKDGDDQLDRSCVK
jgi:hypothetical protein